MPPARSSRFAELPLLSVTGPDGEPRDVVSLRLTGAATSAGPVRRVVQGESVDLLARRELGDEALWWRLLDANPLCYPLDLEPGTLVRVPAAERATRATRARSF